MNAGARECLNAAGQQLGPVCHRHRIGTRRERSASRVVGGENHEIGVGLRHRAARAVAQDLSYAFGFICAYRAKFVNSGHLLRSLRCALFRSATDVPARTASTSSAVGIAVEHSSLEATIAPAALAPAMMRWSDQPLSRP